MKNNIIYVVVGVVAVIIIGGGLFLNNKNKTTKNESTTSTTQSPSAPSNSNAGQTTSGNKVEDAFVEWEAQATYHTQTNNQAGWTAQDENDLVAKFGVTKEEVDAFSKSLRNDPAHAKAVTIKVLQRSQELQKNGQ